MRYEPWLRLVILMRKNSFVIDLIGEKEVSSNLPLFNNLLNTYYPYVQKQATNKMIRS